jgi:hypothetical protein
MDRKDVSDRHVAERYLAGQLSDSEAAQFEALCATSPDVVRDVEEIMRMKEGLATLRARGELDTIVRRSVRWYRRPTLLALAASIAAVSVGTALWFGSRAVVSGPLAATLSGIRDAHGRRLAIASRHTILRTRAGQVDAEITLPAMPGAIELRILPEDVPPIPPYRLRIERLEDDDSRALLADVEGLTPAADGFVQAFLNSGSLGRGRYFAILGSQTKSTSNDSEFVIRVGPVTTWAQFGEFRRVESACSAGASA